MSKLSDPKYLLKEQYQNASNLNARIQLHERFSTNKYGWHLWVFDQFNISPKSCIIELGCGAGTLWLENAHRIPDDWDITLSDLSLGMLEDAQRNLRASQRHFKFATVDAQSIPFEDKSFDAVIANHMLYHVPDMTKAFSEVRRILKPGGRFYASTNGRNHLRELGEFVRRFEQNRKTKSSVNEVNQQPPCPPFPLNKGGQGVVLRGTKSSVSEANITFKVWEDRSFSLENGLVELSQWFPSVNLRRYEDSLAITEVDPLVAYVLSSISNAKSVLVGDKLVEFINFVKQEMTLHGVISVTKNAGIFEAYQDNCV